MVFQRGFQPSVDDAVDENATGDTLDVADVVDLVPFRDHGVDSDEKDPHFWQDPLLLADVGDAVADQLAKVDPDARGRLRRQRRRPARRPRDARPGLHRRAGEVRARHTVVVSHDAFGYLQKYGLTMDAILGLSPDAEPTPADLARLQELITDEGVTTVFSESLVSPETAEQLASDMGVRSAVLDPIEGLSDETADEDYLSLMRSNLAALEEANGC